MSQDINTEVALLKKEVSDIKVIFSRHDIKELHSRVTSNYKELTEMITQHHKEQALQMQQIKNDLASRVGVLEKWRWVIIGGSIVIGFIIQKFLILS